MVTAMSRGKGNLTKKVLDLFPIDGSEIRAKELLRRAKEEGLHQNSVQRKLSELTKKEPPLVYRRQESQKTVFYSSPQSIRVEHVIANFIQEISSILSKLPRIELRDAKNTLMDLSPSKEESRAIAEIMLRNPKFLKQWVLNTLLRQVYMLFKENLPTALREMDFYIGVFENESLKIVPRSEVERK
jgi:hypothetical protein